jgi:hypothetical protein
VGAELERYNMERWAAPIVHESASEAAMRGGLQEPHGLRPAIGFPARWFKDPGFLGL